MSNIDLSQLITAEDKAGQEAADLLAARKAECRQLIYAVVDQTAQMNLANVAAAGLLSEDQQAVHRLGLAWIDAMRGACHDPDGAWPDVPPGVAELAELF